MDDNQCIEQDQDQQFSEGLEFSIAEQSGAAGADSLEELDNIVARRTDRQMLDLLEDNQGEQEPDLTIETVQPQGPQSDRQNLDIGIDQQSEQLAEDEITEVLTTHSLMEGVVPDDNPERPKLPEGINLLAPRPIELIVTCLEVLDKPFSWVPRSVKQATGYLAVAAALGAITTVIAYLIVQSSSIAHSV